MTLASVMGQPRAVAALQAALQGNSLHHAYLFEGPEGVGKEKAALAFVQALLCPVSPRVGCGTCSSCVRVPKEGHPDFSWLMPDAERLERGLAGRSDFAGTPSRELRVEQIRGLQERLSLRGLESNIKVALISSAQTLNPQAQNAFLKTLEEPPQDTTILLLASSKDLLLPTLRSRCSTVHFGPLSVDFIAEQLRATKNLDPAAARLVAILAGGSLGRALAQDVKALAHRQELVRDFEALQAGEVSGLLRFAETYGASREDAEQALALLTVWNRDVALVSKGVTRIANEDLLPLAQDSAARHSGAWLHRRHDLMDRAAVAIGTRNGSPRLQLERMLIELWGAA